MVRRGRVVVRASPVSARPTPMLVPARFCDCRERRGRRATARSCRQAAARVAKSAASASMPIPDCPGVRDAQGPPTVPETKEPSPRTTLAAPSPMVFDSRCDADERLMEPTGSRRRRGRWFERLPEAPEGALESRGAKIFHGRRAGSARPERGNARAAARDSGTSQWCSTAWLRLAGRGGPFDECSTSARLLRRGTHAIDGSPGDAGPRRRGGPPTFGAAHRGGADALRRRCRASSTTSPRRREDGRRGPSARSWSGFFFQRVLRKEPREKKKDVRIAAQRTSFKSPSCARSRRGTWPWAAQAKTRCDASAEDLRADAARLGPERGRPVRMDGTGLGRGGRPSPRRRHGRGARRPGGLRARRSRDARAANRNRRGESSRPRRAAGARPAPMPALEIGRRSWSRSGTLLQPEPSSPAPSTVALYARVDAL
jgi:hypothetical protein